MRVLSYIGYRNSAAVQRYISTHNSGEYSPLSWELHAIGSQYLTLKPLYLLILESGHNLGLGTLPPCYHYGFLHPGPFPEFFFYFGYIYSHKFTKMF